MRIYIAGPMSGVSQQNFPAFDTAARHLRNVGHDVVSPAELDSPESRAAAMATLDGDPARYHAMARATWGDFMARDVKIIVDSELEGVIVLPGWPRSRGARLETFVANRLCGLPIYSYRTGARISSLRLSIAWRFGR